MSLTSADITAIRAAVQAEIEEYAVRFWVMDTGTGKNQVIDVLADHTLRLQRIEDDTDGV